MRGFPLISCLTVMAIFAVAWGPMQKTIGSGGAGGQGQAVPADGPLEAVVTAGSDCVLRVLATRPLRRLKVEYLGRAVVDAKPGGSDFEVLMSAFVIPADGLDFWIEADFESAGGAGGGGDSAALRIELENDSGDVVERTLWGDGDSLADSVFFEGSTEQQK